MLRLRTDKEAAGARVAAGVHPAPHAVHALDGLQRQAAEGGHVRALRPREAPRAAHVGLAPPQHRGHIGHPRAGGAALGG